MKSFCKSLLLATTVAVVSLLPMGKAFSQSLPEPAVVISIAKFDEQMNDVNYLLTASGFAQMKFMAKAMIKGYTKGLDGKRDAGVMLFLNESSEAPDILGFVPIEDIDEMLDVISGFAEVDEGEDVTTIVTDDGQEMVIKERDRVAFFSNKCDMLVDLPEKPVELLGDLPSKYNLSAKLFAQRIPKKMREQVLEMIRESSEDAFDSFDEDDVQVEFQKKNLELQLKQMEMLFRDSDSLTIGMSADEKSKSLVMQVDFTALPDTKLAEHMAISKQVGESRFTGFLMDGSAFNQNGIARFHPEQAEQYSTMLRDLEKAGLKELDQETDLSEEDLNQVKKSVGELVDVIDETLKEGLFDGGAVLMLKEGSVNFAMGAQISDPRKLEGTIKELIVMAEEKLGDEIEVNLNSGSHKNITLHEIVVQVPDEEEEVRDMLGDQITVTLGIGTKEAYFALGSNPVDLLKKAIDGKSETSDMMQYNVNIAPILDFFATMEGDPNVEAMAKALKEAGNDRIQVTSNWIENGVNMKFEMQDGILGLIKVGVDAYQGGGAFPPGDDF